MIFAKISLLLCLVMCGAPAFADNATDIPAASEGDMLYLEGISDVFPVPPEDLRKAFEYKDQVDAAKNKKPVAETINRSEKLVLEPGAEPPKIRLTPGYSSTILIYDASGSIWPIKEATVGNSVFTVTHPEYPGHAVILGTQENYANSNLTLILEGHHFPVVMNLVTSSARDEKRVSDSLVSFYANKRGPNAKPVELAQPIPSESNPTMMGFLDAVPPSSAQPLQVSPAVPGVTVWKFDNEMYVRSKYILSWPNPTGTTGGEEMRVYRMSLEPSIMILKDGTAVRLKVNTGKK